MPLPPSPSPAARRVRRQRGSLIITALLLAAVVGLGLAGYLALSQNALRLAHRTLFASDANNLAEAGLEEAIYCFNQMNSGNSVAKSWAGWTLSGANAMRTLTPFNRDQNAIGTVKVYVKGCDGSDADPYVISQATIAPFDRTPPIVRIMRLNVGKNAYFANGLVGINGLTMAGDGVANNYNSNPTSRPAGPWAKYASKDALGTTSVAISSGTLSVSKTASIKGDLYTGPGISATGISVTGTVYPNFTGVFPLPVYPSNSGASPSSGRRGKSKSSSAKTAPLGSVLPKSGDSPAADGRYYYFCDNTTIGKLTISAGAAVTIVGTKTDMVSGLVVKPNASCLIYIDGPIDLTGKDKNESGDWAGATQIFTTTTRGCKVDTDTLLCACIYAPNADLTFTGDRDLPTTIIGSFVARKIQANDNVNFIYDEALTTLHEGKIWNLSEWSEIRVSSDRAALGALTGNFLP